MLIFQSVRIFLVFRSAALFIRRVQRSSNIRSFRAKKPLIRTRGCRFVFQLSKYQLSGKKRSKRQVVEIVEVDPRDLEELEEEGEEDYPEMDDEVYMVPIDAGDVLPTRSRRSYYGRGGYMYV